MKESVNDEMKAVNDMFYKSHVDQGIHTVVHR